MFVPLGIKTDYSLLKSLIKIEDLILFCKNNNINTIGILDDNLTSSYMFYKKCISSGIKPIIGLDTTYENNRLFLYPKNMDGLKLLFKMEYDKLDNDINISNYKDNIIAVVPYTSYDIYHKIINIYDEVYLSYSCEKEREKASKVCDSIIFIRDTYALTKNSSKYINYLKMIDENKKLGDIELINYEDNVLSILDYDLSSFISKIDIKFEENKKYIPHYDENISDSFSYLKSLSIKGLNKRLNNKVSEVYKNRIEYELNVIDKMGFTDYFLIVFDYVRYAIKNNIFVGAGRGSAAGSLVAYSLGITSIDPIKYDLLFERFLNPDRITMPDIDIDFEDERREEVVDYVKNRYGEKRVAKIITFGTMTAKEVLRTVGKINNASDTTLNNLLKHIDSKKSLKDNLVGDVQKLLDRNSLLRKIYEESYYLEGIKKHIGTHAAGVVISSTDLYNIAPLIKSGNEILIGYEKDELEDLGLIKMDLLSIKNLTIMSNVINLVKELENKDININNINLNDKSVYELFKSADTVGIFQFESAGMKSFLKRLNPECFDDLVMAIAIYRPGPMQSIDEYLERKNNHKKFSYINDNLKNILSDTYGILIYQEQIMKILELMGNFTLSEADIIRRAISKKKSSLIENAKQKFIKNSIDNGYSEDEAKDVYNLILRFADFGFNKSHSVAYSMIAYQMAYLKVYYKEYYYINLLNSNISGEAKTKEYIMEAKKAGINILKPDINKSFDKYTKEDDSIRLPLRVIKGVGFVSQEQIISERENGPYEDFFSFVHRCYNFNVNKHTLESLIYAGVFDSFGYNRATLIKNINAAITYAELINDLSESLVSKPEMEIVDEYTDIYLMEKEIDLIGFYVSTHPSSKYTDSVKLIDIKKYIDKTIELVVLIENIKTLKTKTNKDMAFILASDETINGDFVLFDDHINLLKDIKNGDLVKIKGRVEKRLSKYQIIINDMKKI